MPDAFDIISEMITGLRNKYGPHSILWYRGSGHSGLVNDLGINFWKLFGGATTTYGNLCWPAGLEGVRLTMGSVKHNVPWDLLYAKTILIWGKNPAETNIQEMAFIASAKEKGCRIIVIDVRRTPTADKADLLLCPNPGTDGALALAIASVLVEESLVDKSFIENHVYGYDEFRKSLSISPADAEMITGIPADSIISLARIIAENPPATIIAGYGLQRHACGGQTVRSILSLAILTGNIGKKGAGFNFANLQGYVFDTLKEPLSYYPDPVKDKPFRRTVSMAGLGKDILLQDDPPLKAAWIERGNPALQSPDSVNVVRAFSGMDFIVVVDQFMSDTASLAHIILPAKDIFEQSDVISSYWSPYIQYKPKILEPEGDVMPESEIYYHLARRMGLGNVNNMLPEPGDENIEKWLEQRIKGYCDITLADIKMRPVLAPGLQQIAYEDMKFETPSGKIELYSSYAADKWKVSPVPAYEEINRPVRFPLSFITPNTGPRIHSQFGNLAIIKTTTEAPALEISPADAKERNIASGDRVKVFNDFGEIYTVASVSSRLPAGIAVLPNGIWLNEGGGGNRLIDSTSTDMGYGAAFHDARVEIEKAESL